MTEKLNIKCIEIFTCMNDDYFFLYSTVLFFVFDIWYLIFGIRYLSENLKTVVFFFLLHRMWSSADYDGLSQQYWSTIHNGLKYTIHQKKGKKLHYKTSFVWTIIIGLNSVFPLFPALFLNYDVSFKVLSKPDSFIIDLRFWQASRHPD